MNLRSILGRTAGTLLMLGLGACGGGGGGDSGPSSFTIGGTVTGLAVGTQVVLNDNGSDPLTVGANGAFTFVRNIDRNGSYAVTLGTPGPVGQTCTVGNGSGTGVTANVTTVRVTCSPITYTVGGAVTGLASGQQVTLVNNGDTAGAVSASADGAYQFTTPVAYNGDYAVTIGTQPTGQTCTVANGAGTGVTASVGNVNVTCSTNTFTIGGSVTGLTSGQQVTLVNGADVAGALTATADGSYAFATPAAYNGNYAVTVGTQPTGQTCTVANGTGTGVTANVANVNVTCSVSTYTIGGTVTGLAAGQQVTLVNSGDMVGAFSATADGTYQFTTPVAYNGSFAVAIGTQPTGQTCTVANGTGTGVTANVANVNVTCSVNTFTLGGTVTGLSAGQVTLVNGSDVAGAATVAADGSYVFTNPLVYNGSYAVTVGTQPVGQTCTVANGAGVGVTANVANVNITCSVNSYTIGGTVTGLTSGQVTLINGGDVAGAATVAADGSYAFTTPVAYNGNYAVTVGTQPVGQTCTVANGAGTGVTANVTNANISCSINTFTIGGTVTGLGGGQVTLLNNGDVAGAAMVAADGSYAFTTPVAYNGNYAVTVGTQPVGKTCSVANPSGAGVTANVSNVNVTCSVNTYTVSGTVTGLTSGQITLLNNGDVPSAQTVTTNNGGFSFTVNYGGNYTVTVGTQPVGLTCTVSNGTGTNVATNVVNVGVSCAVTTYTISGTVPGLVSGQQVTLLNNGDMPTAQTVTTNNGSFSFTVNHGGNYAVTVGTQPAAETCRITGATGAGVIADATVGVSCRLPVMYVTNADDNSLSQYSVNVDGSLTSLGAAIATGANPNLVAVDPTGTYAYVTNWADNTISQYTIGVNGQLSALGTPVASAANPAGIAIEKTGKYLYVTNDGVNTVSQYTIGSNGVLTANTTAPTVASGNHPHGITVDPSGRFVYVANLGSGIAHGNTVSQYTIDNVTGVLVPMGVPTVTAGDGPLSITVNPAGTYAYVNNFYTGSVITQFTIDGTGALTAGTARPYGVADQGMYQMSITPDGKYGFLSNKWWNDIEQCALDVTDGNPVCSGSVPTTSGTQPQYSAIDPFGRYFYAVNYSNGAAGTISQYTIGSTTGLLTPMAGPATTTGLGPFGITITR